MRISDWSSDVCSSDLMPRLSVDLDLVFPDYMLPREEALACINEAVRQTAERLNKRGFQTHAPAAVAGETKLLVRRGSIQVKAEVNFVMRGTVQPVRRASFTPSARDVVMTDLAIPGNGRGAGGEEGWQAGGVGGVG